MFMYAASVPKVNRLYVIATRFKSKVFILQNTINPPEAAHIEMVFLKSDNIL
jgi:hypothetical protein